MEMTEREWEMLMDKFDVIDGRFDEVKVEFKKLNGIRIWKARVTGALYIIGIVLIPLIGGFIRMVIGGR